MVYRRRRIVLSEIDRHCRFVLMAYSDAIQALQSPDLERLWYSLEGLVSAATHLHQLLWPSPDPSTSWAADLRGALGLGDHSPLNHGPLRAASPLACALETWNLLKPGGPLELTNFGPSGFSEPSPANCVRCFSPPSGRFTFFGVTYEVTQILQAVAELAPRAAAELESLRAMV